MIKMKTYKFSIIEIMVVLLIVAMLIGMTFPILRHFKKEALKVATRNMLTQIKTGISGYFSDYGLLPEPGHVNIGRSAPLVNYTDSTPTEYWKRTNKELRPLNQVTSKNAELIWEYLNNEESGSIETYNQFTTYFPIRDLTIKLDPWQVDPSIPFFKKEQEEEVRAIAHSSKFLNYYLSGSGFDLNRNNSYAKLEEKWLANDDTTYRLSWERSVQVKPWLFTKTNEFIAWDGGYTSGWGGRYNSGKEFQLSSIPPVTSYLLNNVTLNYFDYLPKIITNANNQVISKNYDEDLKRRLYVYNDEKVDQLADDYTPKKTTLGSDRMIYNSYFFASTKLNDANGAVNNAQTSFNNAITKLANDTASGQPPAVLAADQAAINVAKANLDKALLGMKNTGGELRSENACIFMRAHNDNVKSIVDAFNSPIVYITYMNQKVESARTYKDPTKDKSMRTDSYIIYSLGQNKADDSNLGENYLQRLRTGDDIIEMSGAK